MKRLARPLSEMAPQYDVVVVGSGYGGGVAASRLARAGQRVCVLERGREMIPGEYPDTASQLAGQVQVDSELERHGDPAALFDIRMNKDVTVVQGCGLGGTSLINANVSIAPEPGLFEVDGWPAALKEPGVLAPYFDRAREMLEPSAYPQDRPTPMKLQAMQKAAKHIGAPFERAEINVNFVDKVNRSGVYQPACNDCGNCVSGCNYGSKNTTLMNYLPDAHNHAASIFTLASVQYVARDGDEWVVHLVTNDETRTPLTVRATIVVLAAGSLGSTEILLRSQQQGLPLSPMVGKRFSTNGDVLAFGYDNHWLETTDAKKGTVIAPVYGVGAPGIPDRAAYRPGPCITGIIHRPGTKDPRQGAIVEEGVIPGALAALVTPAFFFGSATTDSPMQYGPSDGQIRLQSTQKVAAAIENSPGDVADLAYTGPTSRSQTYLVMSHDEAAGRMTLSDDRLRIAWPGAGAERVFGADQQLLQQINAAIEGEFLPNPLNGVPMGQQLVTVHPVGGCGMGDDWNTGVVDDRSRVYSGEHEVYDGLLVCDGAVFAGAVAVNPLLTITALAERSMDLLVEEHGWQHNTSITPERLGRVAGAAPQPGRPVTGAVRHGLLGVLLAIARWFAHAVTALLLAVWGIIRAPIAALIKLIVMRMIKQYPERFAPGVSFTETMDGYVGTHIVISDAPDWERISNRFDIAAADGKALGRTMGFLLTISVDDSNAFAEDPAHAATVEGTVHCPDLSPQDLTVKDGTFQLFPADADAVDTWLMVYDLPLVDTAGKRFHFRGTKYLRRLPGSSPWTDLTKLFVDVTADGPDGEVVASGVLTLDVQDFLRQAFTAKLAPKSNRLMRFHVIANSVNIYFLGKLAAFAGTTVLRAYGAMLSDLNDFDDDEDVERTRRPLIAPTPTVYPIRTVDGASLKLTRYCPPGSTKGPVILAPGFSVTSSSYAIDTVGENLVEYLCRNGYDVWLFAYRGSPDSGSSTTSFNLDDVAQRDWPRAVEFVRQTTGKDVQILAHCVASTTVLMALLYGMTGVKSVICSQNTLHPVVNWMNDLKADLGVAHLVRSLDLPKFGIDLRHKVSFRSSKRQADKVIDAAVWALPMPEGEECANPVCRRVFALWGPSYVHRQLGHETHVAMREMFGDISTAPFEQLADIVGRGVVVDANGNDTYMPHVQRLTLPIDFLAGELNQLFLPESSQRTLDWLVAHNGAELYTRRVFPGYGHMDFWIGKTANVDVFGYVLERLDLHN